MGDSSASHTEWSPMENKMFENALAIFSDDAPDRWINVAKIVPSKTPNEVAQHYLSLVEDVEFIDSGLIAIPRYVDDEDENEDEEISEEEEEEEEEEVVEEHEEEETEEKNKEKGKEKEIKVEKNKRLSSEATPSKQQRRRGKVIPWNEQEHRLFLMGLNKYGRGDWRNISRNYVMTRTPAQVASHAQKYFKRMNNAATRGNRRPSIHDIRAIGVPETRFSINVHAPIYDPKLLSDISYNPTAGGPMIRASNLPMLPKPFAYGNFGSFGNFQPNNLMGLRENPNYHSNSIMDSMGNPSYPSNNMMDTMGNPNFQSNNLMSMMGNSNILMNMAGNSNDSPNVIGNYPPNFPRTSNIDPSGSSSCDYTEYPPL